MAKIEIVAFDPKRHRNPMWNIDDVQARRFWRAPSLSAYKVCFVTVCGFRFEFHSAPQVKLALEYFRREHHPSSRLPVYSEHLGGDHMETQRWFEKLPQFLLERAKRKKVVLALTAALAEYGKLAEAHTGTEVRDQFRPL